MKLIRVGEIAREKPGLLLEDGTRLDVSAFCADYGEAFFATDDLSKLRNWLATHRSLCLGSSPGRIPPSRQPFLDLCGRGSSVSAGTISSRVV